MAIHGVILIQDLFVSTFVLNGERIFGEKLTKAADGSITYNIGGFLLFLPMERAPRRTIYVHTPILVVYIGWLYMWGTNLPAFRIGVKFNVSKALNAHN